MHHRRLLRINLVPPLLFTAIFVIFPSLVLVSNHAAETNNSLKSNSGDSSSPLALDVEYHDVNAVYLAVSNHGPIGLDMDGNGSGFFPAGTSNNYVFGTGLWFGGRFDADGDGDLDKVFTQGYNPVGGDSEFREGTNDQDPDDPCTRVKDSTDQDDIDECMPGYEPQSDQDLLADYTTLDRTPIFGSHQLPLEVSQRSMAYRTGLASQVIFFIFDVENWGSDVIEDSWIGYDSDMDIGVSFGDDLTSVIRDWIVNEGDTVRVDMAMAWDSDFYETNFIGDPGFVGVVFLRTPGNPYDGIDNDRDGLIDESPYNGVDDNGDGVIDDEYEVDELGLVNYSKHCSSCAVYDPQTDEEGYDLLSCNTAGSGISCLESTTPADVRFMISSGPFDWLPGQNQQVVMAMVFASPSGDRYLPFVGDPPRPDPNDDDLVEFLSVWEGIRWIPGLTWATSPPSPNITLIPGDGRVTVLWDDTPLRTPDSRYEDFVELDPTYREYDFEGFRVWRSRTGLFSQSGDPDDPDFPLTPEAILENELVEEYDLTLLTQFDLVNGITTDSHGVTCQDSLILFDSSIVYTECDTFNLGNDTGLSFSYVDDGDPYSPLINGQRYYYCVTAYDYNSDKLPVSRLSLDSGVSFSAENSVIPQRITDNLEVSMNFNQVDSTGTILDYSSPTIDPDTGEPVDLSINVASNAMVANTFYDFFPDRIASEEHTLIIDDFERIDENTNRVTYHIEDGSGGIIYTGGNSIFDITYDGSDHDVYVTAFDPHDSTGILYSLDLTFNVDSDAFVIPDSEQHLLAENSSGSDISDSLGNVVISPGSYVPAGYRASDIRLEWVGAGQDSLTLEVIDLDNAVEVPFGEGIVNEPGSVVSSEKGSNWSFLPVGGGALQPGGRYYLTSATAPIVDLWLCGLRVLTTGGSRMPRPGDRWTLRQFARNVEVDTTAVPPETTYVDARRPFVPGSRYRLGFSPAQDVTSPEFTIGIFQNTILTNNLDLYVVASEELEDVPRMTVGEDTVSLGEMVSDEVELYSTTYRLDRSGSYRVTVTGTDTWGNEGDGNDDFSAGLISRSGGGILTSVDHLLRLRVPPNAIREESRFFLCMSEEEPGPDINQLAELAGNFIKVVPPYTGYHKDGILSSGLRSNGYVVDHPAAESAVAAGRDGRYRKIESGLPRARGADVKPMSAGTPVTEETNNLPGQGRDLASNPVGSTQLFSDVGEAISPIYYVSPLGEQLYRNAELSFDLTRLRMSGRRRDGMGIYRWTDDGWMEVASHLDQSAGRISASVNVLGFYQLRSSGSAGASPFPKAFSLRQNYPNPFNPSTTITFDIPDGRGAVWTELVIYNIRGQRVKTLLREEKTPGTYFINWDGRDDQDRQVSSGIYLYRLKAGEFVSTRKMVAIK